MAEVARRVSVKRISGRNKRISSIAFFFLRNTRYEQLARVQGVEVFSVPNRAKRVRSLAQWSVGLPKGSSSGIAGVSSSISWDEDSLVASPSSACGVRSSGDASSVRFDKMRKTPCVPSSRSQMIVHLCRLVSTLTFADLSDATSDSSACDVVCCPSTLPMRENTERQRTTHNIPNTTLRLRDSHLVIMTIKHRFIGERNGPSETVVQDTDCVYVFFNSFSLYRIVRDSLAAPGTHPHKHC